MWTGVFTSPVVAVPPPVKMWTGVFTSPVVRWIGDDAGPSCPGPPVTWIGDVAVRGLAVGTETGAAPSCPRTRGWRASSAPPRALVAGRAAGTGEHFRLASRLDLNVA